MQQSWPTTNLNAAEDHSDVPQAADLCAPGRAAARAQGNLGQLLTMGRRGIWLAIQVPVANGPSRYRPAGCRMHAPHLGAVASQA